MNLTPLTHLDIRAPLSYSKAAGVSLCGGLNIHENEDFLLCYEINSAQSHSIEPDREQFLGSLVFIGQKTVEKPAETQIDTLILPAGNYLFNQCRAGQTLNQDEWLDIAIEQQKDSLWERYKPGNLLYVRFLCEDGAFVTQVFRPVL